MNLRSYILIVKKQHFRENILFDEEYKLREVKKEPLFSTKIFFLAFCLICFGYIFTFKWEFEDGLILQRWQVYLQSSWNPISTCM